MLTSENELGLKPMLITLSTDHMGSFVIKFFFFVTLDPIPCLGLPLRGFAIAHIEHTTLGRIPQASDQPEAKTSTCQHITLTRDKHPCYQWDSNAQPQQGSSRRLTS